MPPGEDLLEPGGEVNAEEGEGGAFWTWLASPGRQRAVVEVAPLPVLWEDAGDVAALVGLVKPWGESLVSPWDWLLAPPPTPLMDTGCCTWLWVFCDLARV